MIDNKFILNELLGIGGSSKVFAAKSYDGQEFAMKIIRKDKGYSDQLSKKLVESECKVMNDLGYHPNIVNCFGYNTEGSAVLADGIHNIRYVLLEKCKNGSISNIVRQTGPIEENICKFLFLQMASTIKFMHDNHYVHLDIKLENILLDDFFNIKIADMGSALNLKNSLGHTNKRRGTFQYMAPEIKAKNDEDVFDAQVGDVYSLGVWLHLLLTGEFPCEDTFDNSMSSIETETSGDLRQDEPNKRVKKRMQYLSDSAKDLLEEMLEDNGFFRASIDEILQHPWLKDFDIEGMQSVVYDELQNRVVYITNNLLKE